MDMVYTFTAYLVLVTCIATNCTAGLQQSASSLSPVQVTSWETDIDADGDRIHIHGTMEGFEKAKIHLNVTILAETSIAKLCSSTLWKMKLLPFCNTCSMKIVHRKTCNKLNARYRAIYGVMLQCPTTNQDQTCDTAKITVTFTCKDGNQLNRTCIGLGELPSCKPKMTCPDIIRCVYKAESKKCTPPTTTITTPIPMGTKASDTITSGTTTSKKPTVTASSGPASDTAASTTTTDTTASDTPTGTTTPGPASGKTASGRTTNTVFTGTEGQTGVIVGGVVGGLFGGVVITVVIVFLCHACRSERRHTEDEDGAGAIESHTCLGLIHTTSCSGKSPPGTNAVTSQVPDLIKVSAVQQASSAPSDVYDVIKEGDDNQLWVDPSACDQGDYVDITDDMTGVGVYSQAQAAPGMALQDGTPQPAAEYFVLEKDDPTDGDYNKLVRDGATETATDVKGTYNRLVRDGATETTTDVRSTYNRLVRDGATETTTDVQGTYNKLGSMADDNDDNEQAGNNGTAADYFVLEKPEDTSNKLAQAGPGIALQDDTLPSAAEYFVLEKDDPTEGDYNRLVRGGATQTTTDVQDTYNKLGSMVDDNEDNEQGGNNGTAAEYFVLEKPEDTYSKLEGKRSAEEEQETYTKLGEATPERVRTP